LACLKPTEEEVAAQLAELEPLTTTATLAPTGVKHDQKAGARKNAHKSALHGIPTLSDWGEAPPPESFLADVHDVRMRCRVAVHEQLVQPYYDGLRGRAPTRTELIADSVQPFMAGVETSLCAVHEKAVAYRKQSVIEYGDQVKTAAKLLTAHSYGVFSQLATEFVTTLTVDLKAPQKKHHQVVETWMKRASQLELSLRPALGHPNFAEELAKMCADEKQSQDEFNALIDTHFNGLGRTIAKEAAKAHATLSKYRLDLFATLDTAVLPSEVMILPDEKKKSLKKLLREQIKQTSDPGMGGAA